MKARTQLGERRDVQGDVSRREPWNRLTTVRPNQHEIPCLTDARQLFRTQAVGTTHKGNKKTLHDANDKNA